MRLYTYLPKDNTAASDGLLSTSLSEDGYKKYRGRTWKRTKEDVLKEIDSWEPDRRRSKALSALTEPIPSDAANRFREFADAHRLYSFDTKDLIRRRLLRHIRLARIRAVGSDEVKEPVSHKIDWNGKPGPYLFSGIPHYFVETRDGKVPADLVREEKMISFPDDEIEQLKRQNRIFTTRVSDDFGRYSEGDTVLAPWGSRFRVSKRMVIPSLEKHPFYDRLTEQQRKDISEYKDIDGLFLDRIEEKTAEDYTVRRLKNVDITPKRLERIIELSRSLDDAEAGYDSVYGLKLRHASDEGIRKWLLEQGNIYTATGEDGKIVGFSVNTPAGDYSRSRFVSSLCVDPSFRGRGIGRSLLKKVIRDNRSNNRRTLLRVSLNNPAGLHLYGSLGFKPINQTMVLDDEKNS